MNVIVVGGGAAGFFAAITAAERGHDVAILEANDQMLAKVRISGGGRCNVTHSCFEPRELVKAYPRGGKALRGPFSRFQPADTVAWFASRGVQTKTEADGRMFPISDDSGTIVRCLQEAASAANVRVRTKTRVTAVRRIEDRFEVSLRDQPAATCDRLLLATGGSRAGFELAQSLGHVIVPPVPSLFTFEVADSRIEALPGVSVGDVQCQLVTATKTFKQQGPLLVTHWGLSGPAVLKLSAWAARELYDAKYAAQVRINWLPKFSRDQVREQLARQRQENPKRTVDSHCPWELPKRLWRSLVDHAGGTNVRWAELSKKSLEKLIEHLVACEFQISGKGQFKEEFVTCGGVPLNEVDFRTMESRVCAGLFFAGEILDVDGITGGFNFQNAWTTAWIAGNAV